MSFYRHNITFAEACEFGEQKIKELCSQGVSLELVKDSEYLIVDTDRHEPGGDLIQIMLSQATLRRICRKIELEERIRELEELQRVQEERTEKRLRRRRA